MPPVGRMNGKDGTACGSKMWCCLKGRSEGCIIWGMTFRSLEQTIPRENWCFLHLSIRWLLMINQWWPEDHIEESDYEASAIELDVEGRIRRRKDELHVGLSHDNWGGGSCVIDIFRYKKYIKFQTFLSLVFIINVEFRPPTCERFFLSLSGIFIWFGDRSLWIRWNVRWFGMAIEVKQNIIHIYLDNNNNNNS